jgi:hypothetical protein
VLCHAALCFVPFAGGGEDVLYMPNPNELHIITKVWLDEDRSNSRQARQVYRRVD